jgi:hypothetical protein
MCSPSFEKLLCNIDGTADGGNSHAACLTGIYEMQKKCSVGTKTLLSGRTRANKEEH